MKVVQLSGGVGGARLARGFLGLSDVELTVVVNVGDDATLHGMEVSPDLDTVCYTLAGIEGPYGWGRADETFEFNRELARYGIDNTFQLGDQDLALKLARTLAMSDGQTLSEFTRTATTALAIEATVLPATDSRLRTMIELESGWTTFVDYFVTRRHRDRLVSIRIDGAETASPAPGVLESIQQADLVVIGPSNPVLSIWPILAVSSIRRALEHRSDLVAVSPLIGGQAVKGPAREVMEAHELTPDTLGIVQSYGGLVSTIYVDHQDVVSIDGVTVVGSDIMIQSSEAAQRLASEIVDR